MNLLAWRYRQFHISYALGFGAAGMLTGIALAQQFPQSFDIFVSGSLAISIAAAVYSRRWQAMVIIFLSAALIGLSHGSQMLLELRGYQAYVGKTVEISGRISDDPELTAYHTKQIVVDSIRMADKQLAGSVIVSVPQQAELRRGDQLSVRGVMKPSFGRYQGSISSAKIVSHQSSDDPLLAFRDYFIGAIRRHVAEPAASLGLGFVIGQRSNLPAGLDDQLRIVGLTHVVVASGYNLTILVRLSRRLFESKSRYLALAASLLLMITFILISGASPSMIRAGAVTGLSLLAWYYGRRFHPLLLILYVAAATAYINPIYEWYDIGWYLSFLAFAGVLLLAPLIAGIFTRNGRSLPAIWQVIIETVSAQIATLPLILMIFGTLPVLSVVSNALVAPVIPLAMLMTSLTGLAAAVLEPLAVLAGQMTAIVIGYVLAVVAVLSKPDWAQLQISISAFAAVLSFGMIAAAAALLYRKLRFDYRQSSIVE